MPKTYVFIGDDYGPSSASSREQYERLRQESLRDNDPSNDIVIISPPQSMTEEASRIEAGSRVIIIAHGSQQGVMAWRLKNKDEVTANPEAARQWDYVDYSTFFGALQNSPSIVIVQSCYAGQALENNARDVPPGTIFSTLVGNSFSGGTSISVNSTENLAPAAVMIASLGSVNQLMRDRENYEWSREQFPVPHPIDWEQLVPNTIVIGGNPPQTIDFEREAREIGDASLLQRDKFDQATQMVIDIFRQFGPETALSLTPDAAASEREVREVARKLREGEPLDWRDQAIAHAIIIAYMDKTGELNQMVAQAQARHAVAGSPSIPVASATGEPLTVQYANYTAPPSPQPVLQV